MEPVLISVKVFNNFLFSGFQMEKPGGINPPGK